MPDEELAAGAMKHAAKVGSGPITGFFDMSETVNGKGLVILNAPNTDLENVTSLAAAGCNITLFTAGRGTPVGSPAAVTLKLTATQKTFEKMEENIDMCFAEVISGGESTEDAADRLLNLIINSANGELSKSEILGHNEVAIPVRGVTY